LEEESSYTAKELTQNPSFKRWINGEVKEAEEARFWDEWVGKNEQNRNIANEAQRILTGVSFAEHPLPNVDQEWNPVHQKLDAEIEKTPSIYRHKYKLPKLKQHSLFTFLKVAAIILIVSGASWYFVTNSRLLSTHSKQVNLQTITTKYKEKRVINFSDGSKIILAAASSLSHTKDWQQEPIKHVELKG
jgi:ferric-dicitrate binding protein FerR (iron transport regulator)